MVVLILYQYDIKYVTKCNTKFKKCRKYGTLRVDLTGVEPVSKNQSPGGFRDRSVILAGVVPRRAGDVSNAAARREAEA